MNFVNFVIYFCVYLAFSRSFLQDCLDLIESKPKGLLTMLDDECRMGSRGTDANYANRLYKEHADTPRFEADSVMINSLSFAVRHDAGQVMTAGCRIHWVISIVQADKYIEFSMKHCLRYTK